MFELFPLFSTGRNNKGEQEMIILRTFSKKKETEQKDNKEESKLVNAGKKAAGIGGVIGGAKILDDVYKEGEVSGRVHLYHGTSKKAAENIKKEGLKKSHAIGYNTITYEAGIPQEELVFTAKKRRVAAGHALPHLVEGEGSKIIKLSIPYEEYKNMKKAANPEMAGAKSAKEYADLIREGKTPNGNDKMIAENYPGKVNQYAKRKWNNLSGAKGTNGTRIFEQDIDPSKIKGSKSYKKNSLKEVKEYIKKNPKRFIKGAGKSVAGAGLIIGGTALATSNKKKGKKKNENTKD